MVEKVLSKKKKVFSPFGKIALGYATVILIGAVFLIMPFATRSNVSVGFVDALFTATSAVSVTGLVVVDTYTTFNFFGQFVVFLLFQIGGLGFMTVTSMLFIAMGKRLSLKDRLVMSESLASDKLGEVKKLTVAITITALVIELIGAISLLPVFLGMGEGVGIAVWRSIFHSVAAFCNAGFDIMGGTGMTPFVSSPLFSITIMVLIFFGGCGIGVLSDFGKKIKNGAKFSFNTRVVVSVNFMLIFFGALVVFFSEFDNSLTIGTLSTGDKILASFFQSVTTRSAGFNTIDQASMNAGTEVVSSLLMIIGVSPASTGGGIKISTFIIILASIKSAMFAKEDFSIGKHSISKKAFLKSFSILIGYLLALIIGIMVVSLSNGHLDTQVIVFECISALSNVGLSQGITAGLNDVGKFGLMFLMYLGRAGFLCLTYGLVTNMSKPAVKYPDGKIIIG